MSSTINAQITKLQQEELIAALKSKAFGINKHFINERDIDAKMAQYRLICEKARRKAEKKKIKKQEKKNKKKEHKKRKKNKRKRKEDKEKDKDKKHKKRRTCEELVSAEETSVSHDSKDRISESSQPENGVHSNRKKGKDIREGGRQAETSDKPDRRKTKGDERQDKTIDDVTGAGRQKEAAELGREGKEKKRETLRTNKTRKEPDDMPRIKDKKQPEGDTKAKKQSKVQEAEGDIKPPVAGEEIREPDLANPAGGTSEERLQKIQEELKEMELRRKALTLLVLKEKQQQRLSEAVVPLKEENDDGGDTQRSALDATVEERRLRELALKKLMQVKMKAKGK